jgi:hypothetical protein
MGNLMEAFFGPRLTPAQVLEKIREDTRKMERELLREAKRAEKAMREFEVQAENIIDDDGIQRSLDRVRDRLIMAREERKRMLMLRAQAIQAKRLYTDLRVQESSINMQRNLLRGSMAIVRFGRSLPNSPQLQALLKNYEMSNLQQEQVREYLGGAMKEATEDMVEAETGGVGGEAEDTRDYVESKIQGYLKDAALDVDSELANLPQVGPKGHQALKDGEDGDLNL